MRSGLNPSENKTEFDHEPLLTTPQPAKKPKHRSHFEIFHHKGNDYLHSFDEKELKYLRRELDGKSFEELSSAFTREECLEILKKKISSTD